MLSQSSHLVARFAGTLLVSAFIAGCANEPPGCADEATLAMAKGAFWQSVDSRLNIDKGEAKASARKLFGLSIELPRVHEKRPDANQIVCAAEIKATVIADVGFPVAIKEKAQRVGYSSQFTADGKQHVVEVTGHEPLVAFVYLSTLEFMSLEAEKVQPKPTRESGSPAVSVPSASAESNPLEIAVNEYQTADKALNAAYQAARSKMSETQQTALRDEQRVWIQRRDKVCSVEAISASSQGMITGGSALELEQIGCRARQTEARTKELATY